MLSRLMEENPHPADLMDDEYCAFDGEGITERLSMYRLLKIGNIYKLVK